MNNQLAQLVLDRIDASGDCWMWMGAVDRKGYGSLTFKGRTYRGHRLVWDLLVQAPIDGLTLDHLCRVRGCVNPDHLEPVSMGENMRRSYATNAARRREATHCQKGHEFTPENTIPHGAEGGRRCKRCTRRRQNEWQRKRRAERSFE